MPDAISDAVASSLMVFKGPPGLPQPALVNGILHTEQSTTSGSVHTNPWTNHAHG